MIRALFAFLVNEMESLRAIAQDKNRGDSISRNCLCDKEVDYSECRHYGRLASWLIACKERKDTMKKWNCGK